MARPAHTDESVRDGDLAGTVAIGVVVAVGLADGLARALSWPFLVLVAGLLPVTLLSGWLFAGPSRVVLDQDDGLNHVGRVRRRQLSLGVLTSIEHPGGRRRTALTFWDESGGVAVDLRDLSFSTEPFRRRVGERLRAMDATGIAIDKRAAELLFIDEGRRH